MMKITIVIQSLLLAFSLVTTVGWSAGAGTGDKRDKVIGIHPAELAELSLEELMDIEVTTVSKKGEKLSQATAAIYVITNEEIRRSGVTSIPEALRLAPGLEVGRVQTHTWAVSSRGFNDTFANKLLVMIDGRSIYTPLFSGVFWDMHDVLLEDVDRIEIIRGPGATLWGANAVNGVINIITKSAEDTPGALMTGGVGIEERGFVNLRNGSKLGEDAHFRVYTKYFNRDKSVRSNGDKAGDNWYKVQGGFRLDWNRNQSGRSLFALQGDFYSGNLGQTFTEPLLVAPFTRTFEDDVDISGGNLLGRWSYTFSDDSDLAFQIYYDLTRRQSTVFKEDRHTYDLDFQHRFPLSLRKGKRGKWLDQDIVWGLGYRLSNDEISWDSFTLSFEPKRRATQLFSAFVQDEISLVKERLRLTLGSKFEQNDFTGSEVQPNLRLLLTPSDRHTLWSAVSRAVRTPSRAEDDVRLNQRVLPPGTFSPRAPLTVISLLGNRDFDSERMLAYEIGYRLQPIAWFSLDFATFYNVYNRLRSLEAGQPFTETSPAPPHLVVPIFADNKLEGKTYGAEGLARWQVAPWWRLLTWYSYLRLKLGPDKKRNSQDTTSEKTEGNSPGHQFSLRSSMEVLTNLHLDFIIRYVAKLPNLNIKSYGGLDVRLAWEPLDNDNLELSLVGQNLLHNQHPEFAPSFVRTQPTEVERGVYIKITRRQ